MEGTVEEAIARPEEGVMDDVDPPDSPIADQTKPYALPDALPPVPQETLLADVTPVADDPPPATNVFPGSDVRVHAEEIRVLDEVYGSSLRSDEHTVLSEINNAVGSEKVSVSKLSFAPQ